MLRSMGVQTPPRLAVVGAIADKAITYPIRRRQLVGRQPFPQRSLGSSRGRACNEQAMAADDLQ